MSSFGQFLRENKMWWILPIVIVLAVVTYVMIESAPQDTTEEQSPFTYDNY